MAGPEHALIGLDIGGTKVAGGLALFPSGQILCRGEMETQPILGADEFLARIQCFAGELLTDAKKRQLETRAIGIAVCELIDVDGILRSNHTLPWKDWDLAERLQLKLPVQVEADVRAAALAESQLGAGRNLRSFLFVGIGTGISCCFVQEGSPWTGHHGAAGTFASSPLPGDRKSLEDVCSGRGLVEQYRSRGGVVTSAKEIFEQALLGQRVAQELLAEAGFLLGQAVGWLVNVLDPQAVIVGGGVGLGGGVYWQKLEQGMRGQIWAELHRGIPLQRAQTGSDAGWLGAAIGAGR